MSRTWARDSRVLERRSGPRWVLLPPPPHEPLVLDGPAATIWELLPTCSTLDDLLTALRANYDDAPASLAAEVEKVLTRLQAEGALVAEDGV